MDSELPSEHQSPAGRPILLAMVFCAIATSTMIPFAFGMITTTIAKAGVGLVVVASAGGSFWFVATALCSPPTKWSQVLMGLTTSLAMNAVAVYGLLIFDITPMYFLFIAAIYAGIILLRERARARQAHLKAAP